MIHNKYTEMWEHRSTEKGAVLTADELKYNHSKKHNNLPLKIRDSIAFDYLEILLLGCMKENR